MVCREICKRYKAVGNFTGGRYNTGQKRCQICEIWIRWDGFTCPCCGVLLRTKPRNVKLKAQLRKSQGKKT